MLSSYRAKGRLRRLIRDWVTYRELVISSLGSRDESGERDQAFMSLKASLAAQLPALADAVPPSMTQETAKRIGMMTDLLNRFRSLKIETVSAQRQREEFDRDWHEDFIFLNKLLGMPLGRGRSHGRAGGRLPSGMPSRRLRRPVPGFRFLGFLIKVGVVFLAIYLVATALGLRFGENNSLAIGQEGGPAGIWQNLSAGFHSVWGGVFGFLDPVFIAYGPTLTLVLLGILLLGIAYWVFVRG